jgi:signal transduction histidine kinase
VNTTALEIRQANRLYQIGRMLYGDASYQATLEGITAAAHDLTGAQSATLILVEYDGSLVVRAMSGPGKATVGDQLAAASGIAADAIREGRPLVVEDVVAVPLISHTEAMGVLTVAFALPLDAREPTMTLIGALAEQATAAVKLERIQVQLIQNEKLTAIGQLIQGFAHDINTPLSVVITNLSVLRSHVENLGGIAQAAQVLLPDVLADSSLSELAASLDAAVQGADLAYTLEDLPELLKESTTAARRISDLVRSIARSSASLLSSASCSSTCASTPRTRSKIAVEP